MRQKSFIIKLTAFLTFLTFSYTSTVGHTDISTLYSPPSKASLISHARDMRIGNAIPRSELRSLLGVDQVLNVDSSVEHRNLTTLRRAVQSSGLVTRNGSRSVRDFLQVPRSELRETKSFHNLVELCLKATHELKGQLKTASLNPKLSHRQQEVENLERDAAFIERFLKTFSKRNRSISVADQAFMVERIRKTLRWLDQLSWETKAPDNLISAHELLTALRVTFVRLTFEGPEGNRQAKEEQDASIYLQLEETIQAHTITHEPVHAGLEHHEVDWPLLEQTVLDPLKGSEDRLKVKYIRIAYYDGLFYVQHQDDLSHPIEDANYTHPATLEEAQKIIQTIKHRAGISETASVDGDLVGTFGLADPTFQIDLMIELRVAHDPNPKNVTHEILTLGIQDEGGVTVSGYDLAGSTDSRSELRTEMAEGLVYSFLGTFGFLSSIVVFILIGRRLKKEESIKEMPSDQTDSMKLPENYSRIGHLREVVIPLLDPKQHVPDNIKLRHRYHNKTRILLSDLPIRIIYTSYENEVLDQSSDERRFIFEI
ncbi:MAG: hypothetical protein HY582_00270, partial [Candidatus Omnitrophica bacterium]|nr:hypothetical protein [Candidatus Omnitrophota bacterium]